ncbi:hypothetical protein BGW80DRAFT_1346805 [Lactifluus volemus]|nr:hypothetical protein BGW80DRAFT_1346805 [Lactifluus volemus]
MQSEPILGLTPSGDSTHSATKYQYCVGSWKGRREQTFIHHPRTSAGAFTRCQCLTHEDIRALPTTGEVNLFFENRRGPPFEIEVTGAKNAGACCSAPPVLRLRETECTIRVIRGMTNTRIVSAALFQSLGLLRVEMWVIDVGISWSIGHS